MRACLPLFTILYRRKCLHVTQTDMRHAIRNETKSESHSLKVQGAAGMSQAWRDTGHPAPLLPFSVSTSPTHPYLTASP